MDEILRVLAGWLERRWLQAALAVVLVVVLGPTPRNAALVEAVRQGTTALGAGQPASALRDFERALELEPEWTPFRQAAAHAAAVAGDEQAAAAHLARLPGAIADDELLVCTERLTRLSAHGPSSVSASEVEDYLACTDAGTTLSRLAEEWIAAGQLSSAEELARAWTMAAPDDAAAWGLLGRLTAVGTPSEAAAALERSISLDPTQGQRMLPLLGAARGNGSPASAAAEIGQVFLQQEEWTLAQAALERAIDLEPSQARARAFLGLARERTGGDGMPDVSAALVMQPSDPAILALHASLLRSRGALDDARDELLAAAALAPNDPAIAAELAATYTALGDLPSASAAYEQAVRSAPQEPRFWLLLAQFSAEHSADLEGLGLPAARNAVSLDPNDPSAWHALGKIHALLGNGLLADRALRRALAADPLDAETWYDTGLLRLAQEDVTGARQALLTAIELDPDGTWADLAQRALDRVRPP